MYKNHISLAFFALLLCFVLSSAAQQKLYVFTPDSTVQSAFEIKDLFATQPSKFRPIAEEVKNFGIIKKPVWLVLTAEHGFSPNDFLRIDNPHIDSLSLYQFNSNIFLHSSLSGDKVTPEKWEIRSQVPHFEIHEEANFLVMRVVKNGSLVFPYQLLPHKEAFFFNKEDELFKSFYLGFLIVTTILGIGLWVAFKRWMYAFYALYAFTFFHLMFIEFGYAYHFLWAKAPLDISFYRVGFGTLNSIALINFIRLFLYTKETKKWVHQAIVYQSYLLIFQIIFFFSFSALVLTYYYIIIPWYFLNLLVSAALIVIAVVASFKKHKEEATFIGITFGIVIVGALSTIGLEMQLLPYNAFTKNSLAYTSAIEVLMLSAGISMRINAIYRARIRLNAELLQEQKKVLSATIKGEEQERKRLATELHDGIGSNLLAARLKAESGKVSEVREILDQTHNELRQISHNLIPPAIDVIGLSGALKAFIDSNKDSWKFKVFYHANKGAEELKSEVKITLYRIVQEALSNVHIHANATEVSVILLKQEKSVCLTIEDNGKGMPKTTSTQGIGLLNMRSRIEELQGVFSLDSVENVGTTLIIEVPLLE